MNLYDLLGVEASATAEEIKKAYRKLANKHHPDKGGDPEQFKIIVEAYSILMDDDKRSRYDSGESAEAISRHAMDEDSRVIKMLVELFVVVVGHVDVDRHDVLDVMKANVKNAQEQLAQARRAESIKIKKFQTVLERMKTDSENNIFAASANSQIANAQRMIEKFDSEKTISDKALKLLDAYFYEFDEQVFNVLTSNNVSFTFTQG